MYVIRLIFLGLSLLTVSLSDHHICLLRFLKAWEINTYHALGHMKDSLRALELDISEF